MSQETLSREISDIQVCGRQPVEDATIHAFSLLENIKSWTPDFRKLGIYPRVLGSLGLGVGVAAAYGSVDQQTAIAETIDCKAKVSVRLIGQAARSGAKADVVIKTDNGAKRVALVPNQFISVDISGKSNTTKVMGDGQIRDARAFEMQVINGQGKIVTSENDRVSCWDGGKTTGQIVKDTGFQADIDKIGQGGGNQGGQGNGTEVDFGRLAREYGPITAATIAAIFLALWARNAIARRRARCPAPPTPPTAPATPPAPAPAPAAPAAPARPAPAPVRPAPVRPAAPVPRAPAAPLRTPLRRTRP